MPDWMIPVTRPAGVSDGGAAHLVMTRPFASHDTACSTSLPAVQ
ncbi:hypothetical protein [Roseovarius sp. D0-M9]